MKYPNLAAVTIRLTRQCCVVAAFVLAICARVDADEPNSDSHTGEKKQATLLEKAVSYRPLLGGLDDPVTGTHINGQLFLDGAAYFDDRSRQFDNEVNVRRARLTFRNGLLNDLTFKASVEIASNPVSLDVKDFYLLYTGLSWGSVVFGNRKEPFSLEKTISSRYTTLMEKALPVVALAPGRNVGVTLGSLWDKRTTLTVGIFGQGFEQDGLRASGTALTGRATHLLVDRGTHLFHLGLSGSYRHVGSTDSIQFRSRPEVGITENYMADTGDVINAIDVPRAGLELAYVDGPFSVQSEAIGAWVTRGNGGKRLFFSGWYVHGGWFLTGESRPYERGSARLGQVSPLLPVDRGGKGAWEMALRLSRVDLTDDNVIGGEESNLTIGLNWYLSSTMRMMANYVNVLEMDRPGSDFDGNTMSLFQMRFQIEF
jgi:phosphate-selective porin OprO/OprP